MPQIKAQGTHESFYRAERATITARVSVASADRSASIADATALHNWIAALAQELRDSGDATWHSAEAPSTWARKSYPNGSNSKAIVEHVTSSRLRMKLSNLERVGSLVERLSNAGAETDVDWALTEVTRRGLEREARKAAVREARAIAEDYAEALGERIVRVVSISDASGSSGFGGGSPRALAAASHGGGAEISIAELVVRASVVGEFESDAPTQ